MEDIKECLKNKGSNLKSLIDNARKDRHWKYIKGYLHKRIKSMELTVDQFHILRQYIKVPKVMRDPIMYYYYLLSENVDNPLDDEWYKQIINTNEDFSERKMNDVNIKFFKMEIKN